MAGKAILQFAKEAAALRNVCKPVADVSSIEARTVLNDLLATASGMPCLGLAAPQIGSDLRMFVMRTPKFLATHPVFSEPGDFMALINPVMKARSDQLVLGPEGCLSFDPEEVAMVPRYSFVNVEYTTPHGEVRRHAFTGLPATVWQHENDHLDGVVMLDRCLEEAEVQQFGDEWEGMKQRALDRYDERLHEDYLWGAM